jgi:septum formation inhibitor MinC
LQQQFKFMNKPAENRAQSSQAAAIDIRFGQVGLVQVRIRTTDPGVILDELTGRVATAPRFFNRTGVCLDLTALERTPEVVELRTVIDAIRRAGMLTIGLASGCANAESLAQALDLPVLPNFRAHSQPIPVVGAPQNGTQGGGQNGAIPPSVNLASVPTATPAQGNGALRAVPPKQGERGGTTAASVQGSAAPGAAQEVVSAGALASAESVSPVQPAATAHAAPTAQPAATGQTPSTAQPPSTGQAPSVAQAAPTGQSAPTARPVPPLEPALSIHAVSLHAVPTAQPTPAPPAEAGVPALLHHQTVRSGQRVYARNRDLVITATVGAGAEVMADGCVHIYGALRGRAMAGAHGDVNARVFCQEFNAELVSIAGVFRVFETIPPELAGKPVQAWLAGDDLHFAPIT